MQNKSLPANQSLNEVQQPQSIVPPIPENFAPTISGASAILSAVALITSMLSFGHSKRSSRLTAFDSQFVSPLRLELRAFSKECESLNAFVFPSGKTLAELKNELQEAQSRIELAYSSVSTLLREFDDSKLVSGSDWADDFDRKFAEATLHLEAMSGTAVGNIAAFQSRADRARLAYREMISCIRQRTETNRSKI